MTREEEERLLAIARGLHEPRIGGWVEIEVNHGTLEAVLDGFYTLEQLEAIIAVMRAKAKP